MGSNAKEGAIKEVIIVVRSLINSLKPPVSLHQIERDYMQVEAQPIPFRSLGYRSSLEFLQDTDAFNFQKFGNDIIISVRSNSKSGHIATLVRCQKSTSKGNKTLFIRPQAPAVRQNVRPIVNQYTNNNNWRNKTFNNSNNYNHTNNNNIPQQGQAELERLRSEIREQLSQLRKQQHDCQQQELELQRYHLELREQLKQQQRKTDTQINQLRQQHAVGLEVQADVIKKLEGERLKLQQQLKQQQREQLKAIKEAQELKQQQRQQREQAILKQQEHELQQRKELKEAKFKQQEQELQQRQEREQAKIKQQEQELQQRQQRQQREQAKAKQQEQELQQQQQRKEREQVINQNRELQQRQQQRKERDQAKSKQQEQEQKQQQEREKPIIIKKGEKVDNHYKIIASNILTPPNSPPEMNGNAAAPAAAAAGAATAAAPAPAPGAYIGRKLNLRPILGNSASQQQQQQQRPPTQEQTTDANAAMKRQQHPRIQYSTSSRGGGSGGSSVNYRLKQQQLLQAAMSEDTTAAVPSSKPIEPKTPEKVANIKSSIAPNTPSPMMQNKPSERTVQFRTENDEFIDGLYNALIKHNGIVINKLPQWYEDTVKRQLPSNWMDIISSSPQIRIENGVINDIVFANTPKTTTTVSATEKKLANLTLSAKTCTEMPELQLPWVDGQQDWSMYITHCDNTTHVWARLIEQSAHFENLTEQLNAHMSEASKRQPLQEKNEQPVEQKIYLVEVSENWNRVRVMSLDAEKRQCSCHFVDFGDEVTFSYDLLHMCPSQFLALPAQAVCLSMYALDKFEEHPHALAVLNKELAGHSVVTRIITSEKQFHAAGGLAQGVMLPVDEENVSHRRACIVGTFYDTSTAEDIHLNDLVADKIIRNTPAPQLKLEQKPNNVLVSHVNDVGDLMVQLPNEDLDFVQRCMAKMMTDNKEQQRVCYSDLLHDRLICVCDEAADGVKQYYRGMLVTKPKTAEEEVFDVYYVDDGRLRKTHISNIYRLEANNLALASYPAQALRVRLHDVPQINGKMLDLLRRLLSPQSSVLVKVIEGVTDKLPMVNLLARGTDGLYVCINIAIRTEYEMHGAFDKPEPT